MSNKKKGLIGGIIVVVVMIVLIVIYTQKRQNTLDAFTGTVETTPVETETVYEGILETYTDNDLQFSIGVPEGWRYVDMKGTASFIHQPSSSSLRIEITDYDPEVNSTTAEDLIYALGEGGSLNSFSWTGNSSYAAAYQKTGNSGTVSDCLEFVYFDRRNIVTLIYIVPDQYYSKLESDVVASIDSFVWDKADPFPDGTFIVHSSYGDYEFIVPETWSTGSTDTSYYAQDPITGAEMTVRCMDTDSDFSGITQVSFVNTIAASYNNYMLQNYAGDSNRIYASATYYSGDTQYYMVQYFLTSGYHEYSMYLSCPVNSYSPDVQATFDILLDCFRYFEPNAVFEEIIPEETTFPTELSVPPSETASTENPESEIKETSSEEDSPAEIESFTGEETETQNTTETPSGE